MMNAILYQPSRKDTHIILLILRVLPHNRLLNRARNLELQHRLLCMFQEVLTFRQQLRRRLERIQHGLHVNYSRGWWGLTSAACLDRGFYCQWRELVGVNVNAVASILESLEEVGERL